MQTNTPRFSAYVASKSALDAFSRCIGARGASATTCKFTTVYMPLVRTPMIAPTDIYEAFPTLTPEEAAQMLVRRDDRQAQADGLAARAPSARCSTRSRRRRVDIVLNTAYNLFPDSKAAKKKTGRGRQGRRRKKALPADQKKDDGEMSTEAVAMAYLLRGVHF